MFHLQIKEFLNAVCEQIKYKPIRNSISEELENHIEESKENYIRDGLEEKNLNLIIEANFNLPFVSYGRLNLIVNMMCLTLVLAICRRKDILVKQNNLEMEKIK